MTAPLRAGRGGRRPWSRLGREASEPLGLSLGAAAALAAWLLAVPAGVAVLIGFATWVVRTAVAALGRRGGPSGAPDRTLPPGLPAPVPTARAGDARVPTAGAGDARVPTPVPTAGAGDARVRTAGAGDARVDGADRAPAAGWTGGGWPLGRAVVVWRSALDRCLAAGRAVGGQVRRCVERVVDRPVARLTPGRHDRNRVRLRSQSAAEDPSPPAGIVDQVLEPVTLALGLAASGGAVLAGLPAVVAACIGAATVFIRAAVGALEQRATAPEQPPTSPIDLGSIEAQWLDRARRAAATFSDVALSVTSEPLAGQAAMMRLQITETLGVLEGLAVHSSAARRVLERTDVQALGAEAERLRAEHAWASGTVATLLGHSLATVEARMDLHGQLQTVRAGLLARLEIGIVHLEHLASRMTKLAVGSVLGPAPAPAELDELFARLAAVRPGLLAPADDARRAWDPGATAAAG
ncbi:MAG TPA: hypothetical protein VG276_05835 [Actinomycetes bacterium]|nr:hypothetical protein [Actinomycetes bacterium]